ncbi:MAG: HNH endonuclease signature motif containing protein [Nanoarchaeota archaeon]
MLINFICQNCKKIFKDTDKHSRRYCSVKCRYSHIEEIERMKLRRTGKKHTEETKKKMSEKRKGIPHTEEWKFKVKKVFLEKAIFNNCLNCGKSYRTKKFSQSKSRYCSKECQYSSVIFKKMMASNSKPDMKLEKNSAWKGGISFEPYSVDWTETLKRAVRERDKYICKICGLYGLDIHHIDYNKKNCDLENLITLCHSCHAKTNYNRDYWQKYFKNL